MHEMVKIGQARVFKVWPADLNAWPKEAPMTGTDNKKAKNMPEPAALSKLRLNAAALGFIAWSMTIL